MCLCKNHLQVFKIDLIYLYSLKFNFYYIPRRVLKKNLQEYIVQIYIYIFYYIYLYILKHWHTIDNFFMFIFIIQIPLRYPVYSISLHIYDLDISGNTIANISLIGILTKRCISQKINDDWQCFLARIRFTLARILISSWESVTDKWTHLDDILVGEGLVGFVVLGVLEENLVHVGACILVQLVARTEDNQRNLAIAQYR